MAINWKFWQRLKVAGQVMQGKLPFINLFGYEKTYGAPTPQDLSRQIEEYKSWAFACTQRNAFSIAKCILRLYKKSIGKEDKIELTEIMQHPFLELMQNVNPFFNKFELWTLTTIFLEMTGNAYWWLPRSTLRIPMMIWALPSHWIKIVPSTTEFIAGYVMTVPGKGTPIPLSADEIVHFKYPSPFSLYYGTGPLFAAAFGVDLNNEIKKWGINYFMNNAQPSGVLYTDQSIQEGQYQRLRDEWNRKHRGSENAGKLAILTSGLKYQQIGSSLKDAKFEDVSREIRDEILAIFGVPASKLGLVEDVNRANADANDYTYQKETILPRLLLIEEKINEKIMPIYDEGLIVKFDNPVPEDKEYRLREQGEHIRSGYSSIDDERIEDKKEPYEMPETEVPLIPFSSVPAGSPKPELSTTPIEEEEKSIEQKKKRQRKWEMFIQLAYPYEKKFGEKMREYFQRQHSEVMKNLARYRAYTKEVKAGLEANIIFNMNEWNEILKGISNSLIKETLTTGVMLAMQETDSVIDFNLFNPNILRAVEQRVLFFSDKVNSSTVNLLSEAIKAGVAGGETMDDIARRIDRIFQYSEDFRSMRTAQTEVVGAMNNGQLMLYTEVGFEAKEWLTARDEKVRESHQALEGKVIELNKYFTTGLGNNLLYPGDRSTGAPPEDLINCRCTINPVPRL